MGETQGDAVEALDRAKGGAGDDVVGVDGDNSGRREIGCGLRSGLGLQGLAVDPEAVREDGHAGARGGGGGGEEGVPGGQNGSVDTVGDGRRAGGSRGEGLHQGLGAVRQ